MTLNKQMIIFITSILLILLAGTFLLNLSTTKTFLEEQLESHAQDTATSLGLSLSSVADPEDPSSMETMINAVFDRGYYSYIALHDIDSVLLYQRENPQSIDGIPDWFINSISIHAPIAESLVQSGWSPIGSLSVQSHPGYAYHQLWDASVNLLIWFLLAAVTSIILAHFTIKAMLRPLKEMEKQAEAIVQKEYLLQDNLPKTVEFRQVVSAMNAMVHKMKEVFDRDAKMAEKLQKLAYQDSVTEMSNRQHFEMMIDSLLDPNEDALPGVLCIIRLEGFKELNDEFGYLVGDQMMRGLADNLRNRLSSQKALYARLNGTELIAVLPGLVPQQVQKNAGLIAQGFPEIFAQLNAQSAKTHIALAVMQFSPGDKRGPLLAKLDYALEQSKTMGINQAFFYETESTNTQEDAEWQKVIDEAFTENRFTLFQQSAYDAENSVHDKELLIRLKDKDDTIRSAGYFMPAVQKLNKVFEIDQLVIQMALDYLDKSHSSALLAINLTQAVLARQEAINWLLNRVKEMPNKNLAFELPENLITSDKVHAWPIIQQLKSLGIKTGIDHFGANFSSMQYLQELRPDYIKLDAAFSKAIDKDEQTQSYVASLSEMAQSLDISVIAMAVENEEQKQAFIDLGIQLFQGYHFGAPAPLD